MYEYCTQSFRCKWIEGIKCSLWILKIKLNFMKAEKWAYTITAAII